MQFIVVTILPGIKLVWEPCPGDQGVQFSKPVCETGNFSCSSKVCCRLGRPKFYCSCEYLSRRKCWNLSIWMWNGPGPWCQSCTGVYFFEILFYKLYFYSGSMFNTTNSKKELKLNPYVTMVIRYTLSLGHFYKL